MRLDYLFLALDQWVARENVRARAEGTPAHGKSTIRVLGQAALWVADLDLALTATQDLDAYAGKYAIDLERFV